MIRERLILLAFVICIANGILAQNSEIDDLNREIHLQRYSEGVVLNEQLGLRVRSTNCGDAVITFVDNEAQSSLVFTVMSLPRGSFRITKGSAGLLTISESRIVYRPTDGDMTDHFAVARGGVKRIQIQPKSFTRYFDQVKIDSEDETRIFSIVFSQQNLCTDGRIDARSLAHELLQKSVLDFRSGLQEFEKLTKGAREREESRKARLAERAEVERLAILDREAKEKEIQANVASMLLKERTQKERSLESLQGALNDRSWTRDIPDSSRLKVINAVRSLKTLSAAASIGVIHTEYNSRLIDTKVDVDEALELLPPSILKSELVFASAAFIDAGRYWNRAGKDDIVLLEVIESMKLVESYGIRPTLSVNSEYLHISTRQMIADIWKKADWHLGNVSQLIAGW